jgi:hypothetical protein
MENKKESEIKQNFNFSDIDNNNKNKNNENNINNNNYSNEKNSQNKHVNKEVFSNLFFEFGPKHSRYLKFNEANQLFNDYSNFLSKLNSMKQERNLKNEKICEDTEYVYGHMLKISKNEEDYKSKNSLLFPTQINVPRRNIKTLSNESKTFRDNTTNTRYYEENKINVNNNYNRINIYSTNDIDSNYLKNSYNRKIIVLKGRNKLKSTDLENMNKLSIKNLTDLIPIVNQDHRRYLLESYEMKEKIERTTKPAFHIK